LKALQGILLFRFSEDEVATTVEWLVSVESALKVVPCVCNDEEDETLRDVLELLRSEGVGWRSCSQKDRTSRPVVVFSGLTAAECMGLAEAWVPFTGWWRSQLLKFSLKLHVFY